MGVMDWMMQMMPPDRFPTAGKVFLQSVQGAKGMITEKDFNPDQLNVMKQLIGASDRQGAVNYGAYRKVAQHQHDIGNPVLTTLPGLFSLGDALGNVQTTLGQFRYSQDPKSGHTIINDNYDFEPRGFEEEGGLPATVIHGPYGMVRKYASEKMPPGAGRPVRIDLGE